MSDFTCIFSDGRLSQYGKAQLLSRVSLILVDLLILLLSFVMVNN